MATISCRPLSFLCCLYLIIVICEASFGPSYEYSKYCNNSNGNYTANCIYHTNLDTLTSNTSQSQSQMYHAPSTPVSLSPQEKDKSLQTTITIFVPTILVVVVLLIFISIYFRRKKARKILLFVWQGEKSYLFMNLFLTKALITSYLVAIDISKINPTKKAQLDWEKRYKIIRVKSDVFSFGKLVLEIVSGQKNYGSSLGENGEVLLSFAWRNWQEGTITNIIDPSLNNYSQNEMIRCIQIENLANRPTMTTVAHMLNSHSTTFPVPLKPAFFMDSETINLPNMLSQEVNSVATANKSVNEASISELCPR
ncbi:Cysteine-rich receptor-like protein kinase 29 [Glycine soja]